MCIRSYCHQLATFRPERAVCILNLKVTNPPLDKMMSICHIASSWATMCVCVSSWYKSTHISQTFPGLINSCRLNLADGNNLKIAPRWVNKGTVKTKCSPLIWFARPSNKCALKGCLGNCLPYALAALIRYKPPDGWLSHHQQLDVSVSLLRPTMKNIRFCVNINIDKWVHKSSTGSNVSFGHRTWESWQFFSLCQICFKLFKATSHP